MVIYTQGVYFSNFIWIPFYIKRVWEISTLGRDALQRVYIYRLVFLKRKDFKRCCFFLPGCPVATLGPLGRMKFGMGIANNIRSMSPASGPPTYRQRRPTVHKHAWHPRECAHAHCNAGPRSQSRHRAPCPQKRAEFL